MYNWIASYSAASEKRMALISSDFVSFLSHAKPANGVENSGIIFSFFIYERVIGSGQKASRNFTTHQSLKNPLSAEMRMYSIPAFSSKAVGKDPNALGWNLNVSAPFAVERMFFMTEICTRQWHFLEDTTIRPIRR
jgi:hypothetical protein